MGVFDRFRKRKSKGSKEKDKPISKEKHVKGKLKKKDVKKIE